MSGGFGAFDPRPMDDNLPDRKSLTACLVLSTFSCGCEVLRIRTAHWTRVLGAFSVGMIGSGRVIKSRGVDAEELLEGLGGGGGSANSSNKNIIIRS